MSVGRKFVIDLLYKRVFENVWGTQYPRRCLLRYIAKPFLPIPGFRWWMCQQTAHQNLWQAVKMTEIISQQGFTVDVVDYLYTDVQYRHHYDLVIDIHPQFPLPYEAHLHSDAIKIAYITGPNPTIANRAEHDRLRELKKRQKRTFPVHRYMTPFSTHLNSFDAIFSIGNGETLKQFKQFRHPRKFSIPNTGYDFLLTSSTSKKDPHAFLFLGSAGQVFRGLDVVLETFAQLPDFQLYVCGPFEKETDFCDLYKHQLYYTSNIHPVGFIDVRSAQFRELAEKCAFMIYPTCAEGQSGSVLTAMSAGIIPLTTQFAGVDDIYYLNRVDVPYLKKKVQLYAQKPRQWIRKEANRMKKLIQHHHTSAAFEQAFTAALQHVLVSHPTS